MVAATIVPLAIYSHARPRARTRRVAVWDDGITNYEARMQDTATTYANPVRATLDELYRPSVASSDPLMTRRAARVPVHYRFEVLPLFQRYLYAPIVRAVQWLIDRTRPIQSGDVNV